MKVKSLPADIFRCWVHSHEEDTPETRVYRPRGDPLPPSRGREAFEIKENGEFIQHGIAPTDGSRTRIGHWEAESPARIRVSLPGAPAGETKQLTIAFCDRRRLEIRR